MSISFVQSIWTIVAMVFFIAVVIWAWSGSRKSEFDQAAQLPLDNDDVSANKQE